MAGETLLFFFFFFFCERWKKVAHLSYEIGNPVETHILQTARYASIARSIGVFDVVEVCRSVTHPASWMDVFGQNAGRVTAGTRFSLTTQLSCVRLMPPASKAYSDSKVGRKGVKKNRVRLMPPASAALLNCKVDRKASNKTPVTAEVV